MQAEIIAEMREERRELREALQRLAEFEATVKAVEAGLLTLALHKKN